MPNKFKKKSSRESGFVLLVAIGVLMGLLALVVSLVRVSRQGDQDFGVNAMSSQAEFALESAQNYQQALTHSMNPTEMSQLQRNWVLPGTKSIPYRLMVETDVSPSDTTIVVKDLLPLFMALATCRDKNHEKMFLSSSKTSNIIGPISVNPNLGLQLEKSYLIIENELVELAVSGSSILSRGVAGVQKAHDVGSVVYGVLNYFDNYYIKCGREWMRVVSINFPANSILVEPRGTIRGIPNGSPIYSGRVIDFYPYDPELDIDGKIADVSIQLSNEQSRINLNGLTRASGNIFFGSFSFFNNLQSEFPIKNMASSVDVDPSIRYIVSDLSESITLFSEPDPSRVQSMLVPSGWGSNFTGSDCLQYSNTDHAWVKAHAVNVNEANQETLGEVFFMHGLASPYVFAQKLVNYRSGENVGIENYFNGANPFDGYSGGVHYSSAAEEFRAFLVASITNGDITNAEAELLMEHVYGEMHVMKSADSIGPMICFEAGDVWRLRTAVSVGDRFAPKVYLSEEVVVKNNPEPYSDSDGSSLGIGSGNFILNSSNGWNSNYSTFYGVTGRQPELTSIFDKTGNDYIVSIDETEMTNYYSQICKDMIGIVYDEPLNVLSKYGFNDPHFLVHSANVIADFANENVIDFGLRPIVDDTYTASLNVKISNYTPGSGNLLTEFVIGSGNWIGNYVALKNGDDTNYFLGKVTNVIEGAASDNLEIIFTTPPDVLGAGAGPFNVGNVDLCVLSTYDQSYYTHDITTKGSEILPTIGGPFFETVIPKEGAQFTGIRWVDSSHYGGREVKCVRVTKLIGPNLVATVNETETTVVNGEDLTLLGLEDALRLRFYFDGDMPLVPGSDAAPQLFSITVSYITYQHSIKRIVYARK